MPRLILHLGCVTAKLRCVWLPPLESGTRWSACQFFGLTFLPQKSQTPTCDLQIIRDMKRNMWVFQHKRASILNLKYRLPFTAFHSSIRFFMCQASNSSWVSIIHLPFRRTRPRIGLQLGCALPVLLLPFIFKRVSIFPNDFMPCLRCVF